jgi:hypothetical protein
MRCRASTRPERASQHPPCRGLSLSRRSRRDLHGCDAVWAQDLWQSGANSDWLLPNRIYEASYFGCPSIALAPGRRPGGGWRRTGWASRWRRRRRRRLTALLRGLDAGEDPRGLRPASGAPGHGFPADRGGACRRAGAGAGRAARRTSARVRNRFAARGESRRQRAVTSARPVVRKHPISCAVRPLLRPRGPRAETPGFPAKSSIFRWLADRLHHLCRARHGR